MSSDDCQVQNMYRYARKSYKKNCRREVHENGGCSPRDDANIVSDRSPGSDVVAMDMPSCSCNIAHEGEIASIFHKKYPVIKLAQQQLQRLFENTDKILCDNTRCCRSMYDFLCICRALFLNQNKCLCALFFLIAVAFFFGLFFGAASCGSYLGHFNSPILTCIDNLFISEKRIVAEDFRGIV